MKRRMMLTICATGLLLCGCARGAASAPQMTAAPTATAETVLIQPEGTPDGVVPQQSGAPQQTQPTAEPFPDAALPLSEPDTLYVLFCNVGKADATFLQYGDFRALVDTGTKEAAPQLVAALRRAGVESLDAVFLTHTHSDHIGGMKRLCEAIPVARAYAAAISENEKDGENKITKRAEKCGVPLTRLHAGESVPIGTGVSLEVVGPLVYNADSDNDNSLVLRLCANGKTVLLAGDMQLAEEETLLSAGAPIDADVLRVGNHGNPDATGDAFALAVSPSVAVISTDTAVDTDSANPRVRAVLNGADVYITQDHPAGLLLTVTPDGTMRLWNMPAA